ncbi:MAG: TRAP transporter small permease [Chloroflexi bacterium]|nr:TRAP transporter small permease [Chloroflexota bacterium]
MLSRLFDRVLFASAVVAAALVVYMAVTTDFDVIMRYFFRRPTRWAVDFSEYALLYVTFLGAAWVLAREGHVKIDIVLNALSSRSQQLLNIITSLLGAGACGIFFWLGLEVTWEVYEAGDILWKSTIIPKWPVWMVMPAGSLLLTIQFLRRTWYYVRGHDMP